MEQKNLLFPFSLSESNSRLLENIGRFCNGPEKVPIMKEILFFTFFNLSHLLVLLARFYPYLGGKLL